MFREFNMSLKSHKQFIREVTVYVQDGVYISPAVCVMNTYTISTVYRLATILEW